jgi:GntR family transcriptional regulator
MDILISNTSDKPIYDQIETQILLGIVSGELPPGSALPSMRILAKELHVSVITTKRAYEDLERAGLIETVVGKGSFVAAKDPTQMKKVNLQRIEEELTETVRFAVSAGIESDTLKTLLGNVYQAVSTRKGDAK